MTSTSIDTARYGSLLARLVPAVIETEDENERLLSEVEALNAKGNRISPEEEELLKLMVLLIEDYESRKYKLRAADPNEVLRELMRVRGTRQADLVCVFGSKGITSEVVRGKRGISKAHARALSEFFHVPSGIFL